MTDDQFRELCNTFGFAPSRALREMLDKAMEQERERIIAKNAPAIEKINAHINALFLADLLERSAQTHTQASAAAELRRLVAQRDALLEVLKNIEHRTNDPVTVAMVQVAIAKAEEST